MSGQPVNPSIEEEMFGKPHSQIQSRVSGFLALRSPDDLHFPFSFSVIASLLFKKSNKSILLSIAPGLVTRETSLSFKAIH